MKNIGIIHLGDRISSDITKLINYNLISFGHVLSEENNVFLYTKIIKRDNFKPYCTDTFNVRDIFSKEYEDLDELIVYTSDINFYGGADKPELFAGYWYVNKFVKQDKPVWYFNNDLSYFLRDPEALLKGREWAVNYPTEDFGIDGVKIRLLHQYKNPDVLEKFEALNKKNCNGEIVSSDFINFSLVNSKFMDTVPFGRLDEKSMDLVYYGFHRYGKRTNEMHKYFYDVPNTVVYGTINKYEEKLKKHDNVIEPEFKGKLPREILFQTISNSISTVVISDPDYMVYCNVPTRFYESINAGLITFISDGTDNGYEFFGKNEVDTFLRVKSTEDIKEKIEEIKTWSQEKYTEFLEDQKSLAYMNYNDRKNSILNLFKKD